MRQLIIKAATGIAAASLLATLVAPLTFADSVVISGNGVGSTNNVKLDNSSTTTLDQSSSTTVITTATTTSSTGGNSISGTTGGNGGDPSITTGDATSTTTVTVVGGSNAANLTGCGCLVSPTTVKVKGNGVNSKNTVTVDNKTKTTNKQKSNTTVFSLLDTTSKTGKNKISKTTGTGDTSVQTGDASSSTTVDVMGGSNVLNPPAI